MCGIFAYYGPRDVKEVLIQGLKNLEYRGYDSAGMAVFNKNTIHRFRVCGGVEELEKKAKGSSFKNSLGIGHTRWATHGVPSEKNAHPHHFQSVYVVHNGIIENEEEIKKIIDSRQFLSDTDTELIPHLIHHFCKSEKLDFLQSVLKSVQCLKGSYAVAAVSEEFPDEIIAFKSGPPLALCRGEKEFFISSDPHAVGKQAVEIMFLEDNELLFLKKDKFQIFNFNGKKVSRSFKKYSLEQTQEEKGCHPHFMIKEILEQPKTLSDLITNHIDKHKQEFDFKLSRGDKEDFNSLLLNSPELLILACGSSYYSALFAQYFLEEVGKLKVSVEMASEFIYRKAVVPPNTPVLFISQSGETADILSAFKQTQQMGLKSLSLCNVECSSLDRKTHFALSLLAGPERAVASTKTFSASLTAISFLAFHLAKLKGFLSAKDEAGFVKCFLSLPSQIEKVIHYNQFFLEIMEELKNFKNFFYLGRGLYYPIALEGALKLKEIAYLHAEAYPSGEMKHGPLALLDQNTVVLALLAQSGPLYKKSMINIKEARSRGASIISIGGTEKDIELKNISRHHLLLPESHDLFHPLLALIPLQMMAYYVSRSYGYNADKPRNLAKSVTVE